MNKKFYNKHFFIFLIVCLFFQTSTFAVQDIEKQKKQTRAKINHIKWLEKVETNKLYKNQQKLEDANHDLQMSKKQIISTQRELENLQNKLKKATYEYEIINNNLTKNIRQIYKTQRKAFFELLITSEDINLFVDRIYFQKIIIKKDYEKMLVAKNKAIEIKRLELNIKNKKRNLELSVDSINSQKKYIDKAIKKNEDMIKKLQNDKATYEKAEKELEKQSASIGSYIKKTTKTSSTQVTSGFLKPISGYISSEFGYRVHPIFNTKSFHSGIDIAGPNLGAIRASNSGKVIYSGWYGGYGKVVILEHGNINGKPITTLYAHMNSTAVSVGQIVNKGSIIGYEGTTGYSTGPHCHFEVRVNGQPNNPRNYISK